MKDLLFYYTPSFMNPKDLEKIFVQHQLLLINLEENIERSVLTEAKHHALLIGARGIGKTHLISMIYHRISAKEYLKDKLKIAWLREEEWGVATFLDLLVRILNSLIEEYPNSTLKEQVKDLYSVPTEQAEQLAGQILKQYCQAQTLLLLMENLDEIFKGLEKSGQQAFRAYLQNHGFITIVATSKRLFSGVKSRNLPFYGFFSITHLRPLNLEEAIELLVNIAKWRGDRDLADLLITPLGKSRIQAIHYLAGGNHRIYTIFSQFLTTESLDSLVEPFMKTLDDLTPFYQSQMQFVSPQQRKIIEYIYETPGAITVKEIAQYCFISQQTASSQLKQLREMGYVDSDAKGRQSYYDLFYEVQEPLMRMMSIWLKAKKNRRVPDLLFIDLFINFLRVWFSREELEVYVKRLPSEKTLERKYTQLFLSEMDTSDNPNILALLRDWNKANEEAQYQKMLEVADELIRIKNSGINWIRKAEASYWLGKSKDVIYSLLEQAVKIDPKNDIVWFRRARIEELIGEIEVSIQSYEKSIQLNEKNSEAWAGKAISEGLLYRQSKNSGVEEGILNARKEEVLNSLKKFEALDDKTSDALSLCSYAYELIEQCSQGIEYIEQALKHNPDNYSYLERKASILNSLGKKEEALRFARQSVEINPHYFFGLNKLSEIYYLLGDYEKALDSVEKSIILRDSASFSWLLKAKILMEIKPQNFISIIECYDRSLTLEQKFTHGIDKENILNNIKFLSRNILIYIFNLGTQQNSWHSSGESMLKIYERYNLNDLSSGLVESIKVINKPSTSDHTAQAWLEMWQDLAGHYPEFQVALNLLKVAVEYKIQKDKRVLFQLPKEERQILEELLNPV